jgi:hypothetical protein
MLDDKILLHIQTQLLQHFNVVIEEQIYTTLISQNIVVLKLWGLL